ncbi:MAG: hypothetical protein DCC68_19145 [Planctomycetota bacterium]|nr:MAG: hypothetical protein DCC68_19145 [Planctomycetota bacterium]
MATVLASIGFASLCGSDRAARADEEPLFKEPIDVRVPHISTDPSVKYDYDIVYVRAKRAGDEVHKRFYTDFSQPVTLEPGADLMLLHPDGSEEVLVEGGNGSITDPFVSFDGEWVYYVHIYDLRNHSQWTPPQAGADIFKIHVPTRRKVKLTNQRFSPNLAAAAWSRDFRTPQEGRAYYDYGVFNMGPCPLPGGKIVFTSNRDGFRPAKGYPAIVLQLFVMDDRDTDIGDEDPVNLEKIGHLNISGALHPVILKDGRIMYSTLESQGIRSDILWGVWTIHPDGTNWAPLVSAFDPGGAPNGFHFQTQLSDGSIIVEEYYNQNNSGFGALIKLPPTPPDGYAAFGPGYMNDPRNAPWRYGRYDNGKGNWYRKPFMPTGSVSFTPFSMGLEGPANTSILGDKNSPKVGKFTHPSGAPDNHLLTIYSPGPVNHQYKFLPQLDGGVYLTKNGQVVNEPAEMRLIKNDPNYNESWPRALVSYKRIYGVDEPATLPRLANDGQKSPHLPEGTPFGLVGTSSMYKRESYPNGVVPEGSVTATYAGGNDPWRGLDAFTSHGNGPALNWHNQGGDVGLYSNDEIHAVRILAMEPTTDRQRGADAGRKFYNHATERLRVLGEVPVRKFVRDASGRATQPTDPDGNPDTSFLVKIPADTAFTFQTLDRGGMVLNMAQTWHQLRPGEIRTDCGGCHAHSQKPTLFEETAAAKKEYPLWDLVNTTPLVADKARDESKKQWDADESTGVRVEKSGVVDVEYHRDIRPIFDRSCVACHTAKHGDEPAGKLDLDADAERVRFENRGEFPGTYARLALNERGQFGYKPVGYDSWGGPQASRWVRKFQSRRSVLVWKIHGKRLDGFSNDDHPSESPPGSGVLMHRGASVPVDKNRHALDLDYIGSQMPPPDAIKEGKAKPLSDEDKRTIARWIDLGCPIDLDEMNLKRAKASRDGKRGPYERGWFQDDNRPIVAIAEPRDGVNEKLSRILVGMHDYYSGLNERHLSVTADFAVDDVPAGKNLADRMKPLSQGVWEIKFARPIERLALGTVTVTARDRQGNQTKLARTFSVGTPPSRLASVPVQRIGHFQRSDRRPAGLVDDDRMPVRVHVFEDYETEIEKRWWLRGVEETKNVPASLSRHVPNRRAFRAAATKDFDDKQGDPEKQLKAVIFNPVPGPPMGSRTRLKFRYHLSGTDAFRVQIFSLSNNYHRKLELSGMEQGKWTSATVDMTRLRRPDGSGGPLSADERIDDIQFYVDPKAELLIDDIALYEAAEEASDDAGTERFPARIVFTGWFDTGRQGTGHEWPGDFEIVPHEKPQTWDAAKSIGDKKTKRSIIRIDMRGPRPVGEKVALRFRYRAMGDGEIFVSLLPERSSDTFEIRAFTARNNGEWGRAELYFHVKDGSEKTEPTNVRKIEFAASEDFDFLVDDVLLYEPADD